MSEQEAVFQIEHHSITYTDKHTDAVKVEDVQPSTNTEDTELKGHIYQQMLSSHKHKDLQSELTSVTLKIRLLVFSPQVDCIIIKQQSKRKLCQTCSLLVWTEQSTVHVLKQSFSLVVCEQRA